MKGWLSVWALLGCLAVHVVGNEVTLKQDDDNRQRCSGMYSKKAWGGSVDPFIMVKFLNSQNVDATDPLASLLIFEWEDEELIGRDIPGADDFISKAYICRQPEVDQGMCKEDNLGSFVLAPNATDVTKTPIYNGVVHLNNPKAVNYPIRKTGYYCVTSFPYSDQEYTASVEFRNAYGELPAAQIAKLPFYGGLTIVYAVLGIFWAFLYVQNRHDILAVQNYITATLVFLIVEQLMTWGYYDYQNMHGNNGLNKAFMVLVSILNAGRNSLSFFLLLIVCMGYGVAKTTLGKTMIYVRILAIAHFVFGVIYAIASLSITPDSAGPLILLVILPLAASLTAFYVWTLQSLSLTMKDLADRQQKTKFLMYKRLWWCILGSILVIFAFFFLNSISFAGRYEADFVPSHWQTRWFVLDGWLNLVYLFDISFIAYLWRPTVNNRRFAMSDEIAQDDDGNFEFRSIGGISDDEDEDDEARAQKKLEEGAVTPRGPASTSFSDQAFAAGSGIEQHTKAVPSTQPRESLDGETIFAVGEGDDWSDGDDSDAGEHGRLTRKI